MSFSPKTPDETELFGFEFKRLLPEGETIVSAECTISVLEGTDASASSMISGTASVSGSRVSQMITGGVAGVRYCLKCAATFSDGQEPELHDDFYVVEACG